MHQSRPPQSSQEFAQLGLSQLRSGDVQSARRNLEISIQKGFTHPDVWVALGQACFRLNDSDNAIKAYDTALKQAPQHMRALLAKGEALQAAGKLRDAITFYKGALKVAPPPEQVPADIRPSFMKAFELIEKQNKLYENALTSHLPSTDAIQKTSPRFANSIDILLGRSKPYFQQPTRYHFPELPQRAVFKRDEFDWVADIESKTDAIRNELLAILQNQQNLSPYVQAKESDIVLRDNTLVNNPDWSACYLWKNGELQEEMAAQCPVTVEALSKIPMDFLPKQTPSALFSVLKPGTHIPPHHGMINTRLICHLPLIVPDGCGFRVGNHELQWRVGELLIFDDSIEHEAWNKGSETRVVLLFEIWRPELTSAERDLITQTFTAISRHDEV
ncbi:aspartyl/asparaginyl beta-hydroxylase domain-containing protein [Hirschia litorea]|uniref:Aspartyl/asparaginyl beta-hydroxylase domain-containing protein n=1 Tax=Hirschia litorea TaxID=1199156 RepID=A0ABW2IHU2_9PROT